MTALELYPYQREGVEWMRGRLRGLLADDMGLGKTPQAACAIDARYGSVVVCPAYLKANWRDELAQWRPELRVTILDGRHSFRWPEPGEVVVTNYAILPTPKKWENAWRKEIKEESAAIGLRWYRGQLIKDDRPSAAPMASLFSDAIHAEKRASIERRIEQATHAKAERMRIGPAPRGVQLFFDECQALCSNKSERSHACRDLVGAALAAEGRVFGLTGTPVMNRPRDLWNLLTTLKLKRMAFTGPNPWQDFLDAFGGRQGRFGLEFGRPVPDLVVPALRRVMKRRLKRHVLTELPAKRYGRVSVEIDEATLREVEEAMALLAEHGIDVETATAEALATAVGEIGFGEFASVKRALATAKVPTAIKLLESHVEAGRAVVFQSDHVDPAKAVAAHFDWPLITGEVDPSERQALAKRFQAEDGPLGIAMTIRAGGTGLTLTKASHVLRCDRNWVPANNLQAEDRLHRIGQEGSVLVTDLIADHPMERNLTRVELAKTELMAVVDAAAEGATT